MKKRITVLIVLIALIVVGIILYFAVSGAEKSDEAQTEQKEELTEQEDTYAPCSGEITAVEVTLTEHPFTLVNTTDGWRIQGKESMPVNEERVEALLSALNGMTLRPLPESAGQEEYGLLFPAAAVRVTMGLEEVFLRLGDEDSLTGGTYLTAGTPLVYETNEPIDRELFIYGGESFAALPEIEVPGAVQSITVDHLGSIFTAEKFNPDAPQTWREGFSWVLTGKYGALPLREEVALAAIKAAAAPEAGVCYAYEPDGETLTSCGITVGDVVTVNCENGSYTLTIGFDDGEGNTYVRCGDENAVRLMDESAAHALDIDFDEGAVTENLLGVSLDTVEKIVLRGSSGTYTVVNTEETVPAIEAVLSLSPEAGSDEGEHYKLEPQMEITIYRNTETFSQITLEIVNFNSEVCLLRTWGTARSFVTVETINELINTIKQYV